ncbi:MAG: hypothetical protein J6R04_06225 [Clostridia bacterium]|nr:hypothetical protein [Clostridia bacterium]
MNTKKNQRFFKQKTAYVAIGLGMLIVGFLMLWLGWSAVSYYGGWALVGVGFIFFVVVGARQVPESEIRQCIERTMAGLGDDLPERPERIMKNPEPFLAKGHWYGEMAGNYARVKDSKVISDVYGGAKLSFTNEVLWVSARRFCLTTGEIQNDQLRIEWSALGGAEILPFEMRVRLTNSKNATAAVRGAMLRLYDVEGKDYLQTPIPNDMDAEHLCETIARMIADRRA